MNERPKPSLLSVLLVCFAGQKRAAQARSALGDSIRNNGGVTLDDVVLQVNSKAKASVYDPGRAVRGALTPALTWGLFGLLASGGSVTSLVVWAVLGAICGGIYSYYTAHLLTKDQLERVGQSMGPDTSALVVWLEAPDAAALLAATEPLGPATASIAAIADDLSATVLIRPVQPNGGDGEPTKAAALTMLLLRYPTEVGAKAALAGVGRSDSRTPAVELVFESGKTGKRRVSSPSAGVAATAQMDVIAWGLFGVVWGAVVGFTGEGGILGVIENGIVTGVLWAIFGLFAGALYGLWAGRGVSAGKLKAVGPLLPPDSSAILAWADGAATGQSLGALSTAGAATLALRFTPVSGGAILEV